MNPTTTNAQRPGSQPARARVVAAAASMRPRDGMPVRLAPPAAVPMPLPGAAVAHSWQAAGIARFDATNGALGTSTKCPSRPLGPRTT